MSKRSSFLPVAMLLCAALVIGIFTVKDYGESWDEADNFRYADYALTSYRFFFHPADLPPFETNLNLKGPAYFMLAEAGGIALTRVSPHWSLIDSRHFIDFLMFLASGLTLYLLCKRWVSTAAALGATALFLSQPLLWGHAFINPKDIPFMALFSLSILAGLRMVDRFAATRKVGLSIVLAGCVLGITTSVRVIAPLAALIVLGYGVWRLHRNILTPAVLYAAAATIAAYLTWPYLWSSPIGHLFDSMQTMSDFPFETQILFGGHLYKVGTLPRTYFPTLLALQLTEPMLILLVGGIATSIWLWSHQAYREPALLFLSWFLLPGLLIVGYGSPLYDNGRQLYFLLPPLFILSGVALDKLFIWLQTPTFQFVVVAIAVLPGILIGARLHPYEYVYYNALTSGTGGAFRKYEMDYWGISLKELTEHVNASVPSGSRLLVFGPQQIVAAYARPDLKVDIPSEATSTGYDYALMLTRENLDQRRCKGAKAVDEIGRRGAIFAVLKQIRPGATCD